MGKKITTPNWILLLDSIQKRRKEICNLINEYNDETTRSLLRKDLENLQEEQEGYKIQLTILD